MSWRERVRKNGKGAPWVLTEPTKPPESVPQVTDKTDETSSVSFGSTQEGAFQSFRPPALCQRCRHFEARPDAQPDGHCRLYGVSTWATVLFPCLGYVAADADEVTREGRRAAVHRALASRPDHRISVNAKPSARGAVSVIVAIRTPFGIVSGEIVIVAERWNGLAGAAEFLDYLQGLV